MKLCECGCGRVVKNRFAKGHLSRVDNPMEGKHHSRETKRKISEARKSQPAPFLGRHHSEKTRRKISEVQKGAKNPMYGKPRPEEIRERISEAMKGTKNHWYGKHHSEETRKKLSEAHKGKIVSEETRRKLSEVNKGELNPFNDKHHSDRVKQRISEARKKLARQNPEKYRRMFSKAGLASIKSLRKNRPYYINDVPFDSNEERQAMLILCEKFNIKPIEGVNCHIRVNGGEFDFRPITKLFIEYHPWDRKLSSEQYYDQRRKLLDENGFQDCRLVVAKSLKEMRSMRWM